jgi:tRNA A37 threonylcarbamoyladenosine modification protein TsaB
VILYLDTTNRDYAEVVALAADGSFIKRSRYRTTERRGNQLFRALTRVGGVNSITGLLVATGEGTFSRTRHGAVVANAIGFAKSIPVAAVETGADISAAAKKLARKKRFAPIVPVYSGEPSISKAKNHK